MIKYDIVDPKDKHWDALWVAVEKEQGTIKYPYDINLYLKKYRGKIYLDSSYKELQVTKGIEFETEEDLLIFKLTFN